MGYACFLWVRVKIEKQRKTIKAHFYMLLQHVFIGFQVITLHFSNQLNNFGKKLQIWPANSETCLFDPINGYNGLKLAS